MNTCIPTPSSVHAVAGVCKTESPDDVEKVLQLCASVRVAVGHPPNFITFHQTSLGIANSWALRLGIAIFLDHCVGDVYSRNCNIQWG